MPDPERSAAWAIVAHPDDEIIFAGGAILANSNFVWNIVIATHAKASRRASEALAVQEALGALGIDARYAFLEHKDARQMPNGGIERAMFLEQMLRLPIAPGDRIYTHGAQGEYGHSAHKAVHEFVCESRPHNQILTFTTARADQYFDDPILLQTKRRLFRECYLSQQGAWDKLRGQMDRLMFVGEGHAHRRSGPAAMLRRMF
jgi:LmbE family N-acetylglucosaminyl deacetylase